VRLLALALGAGCWTSPSSHEPAVPDEPTCALATSAMSLRAAFAPPRATDRDQMTREEALETLRARIDSGPEPATVPRGELIVVELPTGPDSLEIRCVTDRWSAEARRCFVRATPLTCLALLTPAQRAALEADQRVPRSTRGD
jgi:hypothetical protein